MKWRRLNLPEIEATLLRLPATDAAEEGEHAMTAEVAGQLATGYAYVDDLLRARVDVFAYGETHHILELNHRVLCGVTPALRREFEDHIEATERWFYDRPGAGIASFSDWYRRHRSRPALPLAASLIVEMVSTPQLFIEGNRRTAALLASYVLARDGEPPCVAGPETLADYDRLTRRAVAVDRAGMMGRIMGRLAAYGLAAFLRESSDPRLLAPAGSVSAARDALASAETPH